MRASLPCQNRMNGTPLQVDGIYNEGGTEDVMGDMFASPGTSAAARTAAGCVVEVPIPALLSTCQRRIRPVP